ncbi:MAG TPA: FHA domain-containing protein [Casimicrobiaceae bacterium]|nr:FHA domain-containing protein [Casimicrobiaceae bacterium]
MAKLVVTKAGSLVLQRFVERNRVTVGRERHNDIVIDDAAVSREHAAIVAIGNDHILEDLGSVNGTLVNGTPVPRRILQHGDIVSLGEFELRYLNTKVAADVELERTMYIPAILEPSAHDASSASSASELASRSTARSNFPRGSAWMMAGPRAGASLELDALVTLFGTPSSSAVITRRPRGYYVTHVVGPDSPRVNDRPIGNEPLLLKHGDVVEVGEEKLEFTLDEADRSKAPVARRAAER